MAAVNKFTGVRPSVHTDDDGASFRRSSTAVLLIIYLFASTSIACRTAAVAASGSAAADGPASSTGRCTKCRLDYAPVMDVESSLFFYNECLARCQLGQDVKLVAAAAAAEDSGVDDRDDKGSSDAPAASAQGEGGGNTALRRTGSSSAALGGSGGKPDFSRLIPAPPADTADTSAKRGAGAAASTWVTLEAMSRFSHDGFVYVGRPGFLDKTTASDQPGQQRQASQRPAGKDAGGTDILARGAGPTVSMRMTYPDGDMYIKIWSSADLKAMVKTYTSPSSPAASWAAAVAAGAVAVAPASGSSSDSDSANSNSSYINSTDTSSSEMNSNGSKSDSTSSPRRMATRRQLLTHALTYIKGTDDRYEITSVSYPYTAVAYLNFQNYYACSSSLIGNTGRLVLTAAHCLYNWDYAQRRAVGWYSNFFVAPGYSRGSVAPYGWLSGAIAEVLTVYTQSGDWASDIGLLQLQYHYKNPGSLAYGTSCGRSSYSLISAGYPADKQHGTLWYQNTSVSTDVCSGTAETRWYFDSAQGQSGSAFWTASDNVVRFVLSNASPDTNGAVAITPAHFSWISKFTDSNIAATPLRILVGGRNRDLFIRCDTSNRRCVGIWSRAYATSFYAYPIASTSKFALAVPGTNLCLNLYGGGNAGNVNLWGCNSNNNYVFAGNELWNNVGSDSSAGSIPTVRSDSGGYLWCDGGDRQMLAVRSCWSSWQCMWRLESP